MPPATGFQVAFLVLAVQFFAALLALFMTRELQWSSTDAGVLGQAIAFTVAAACLFGIRRLRESCLAELERPLPRGAELELAIVSLAKLALPFAVIGAFVLWFIATGDPGGLASALNRVDPGEGWRSVQSPTGLAHMVLLSWIAGPIIEELVFRGFLFRAWERQWGWFPSLILTSAVFGLCHPHFIASAFLGSVVYICILRRTGTIRASILVHVFFNIAISWPLLGQFLLTPPVADAARLTNWLAPLVALALAAVALPAYVVMSRSDARAMGAP